MRRAAERQHQVLSALVRLYVQRREPVSSRMIEQTGELDIKSASIRSVLSELERDGLLEQPHASSGRVPTDEGYRAYVDGMLESHEDEPVDDAERALIENALREAGRDMESILHATAGVLGRFSNNIAILAGPRERSPRIQSIDLYARDTRHVLLVVGLDDGSVRSELAELDRELRPELIDASARFLSERLVGRRLDETQAELDEVLEGEGEAAHVGSDVAGAARGIFAPGSVLSLTFEGLDEALAQPEFGDPTRLKSLVNLVARAQEFERALEQFVQPDAGSVSLAIGQENPLPALHPFSLMATRFELEDRYGYLAVLGPRRMRYARLHSLIRLVASHLDSLRV